MNQEIKPKQRLIERMILPALIASNIAACALTGFCGYQLLDNTEAMNLISHKQELLVEFAQTDEFKKIYNIHYDILNEQLSNNQIDKLAYNEQIQHINSNQFIEEVATMCGDKDIIKAINLSNQQSKKVSEEAQKLAIASILTIGTAGGIWLEKQNRKILAKAKLDRLEEVAEARKDANKLYANMSALIVERNTVKPKEQETENKYSK